MSAIGFSPGTANELDQQGEEKDASFTTFVYKSRWFVLAQTDGEAMQLSPMPTWDADKAVSALNIQRIAFSHTDRQLSGLRNEAIDSD